MGGSRIEGSPFPLTELGSGRRGRGPRAGLATIDLANEPIRVAFLGRTSTEELQDPTLSIPRQLKSSRNALPANATIVAHFYDIESGLLDLAARSQGHGHENFEIAVPREGGLQDLLTEAERPDRRFDAVICESISRVARATFESLSVERRLEAAGVPLFAANEPIVLTGKRASQILARRLNQSISEWYVTELKEQAWAGTEIHTDQGYNIGKPPYGYAAERIPHPVPAKREKGATKHKLVPDPQRGPVVTKIFTWRVSKMLGYQAIADRLNEDLDQHPPPEPVVSARALGCWSASSVREVLTNPKHTGYMVWNRRSTSKNKGRCNPPEAWVWSSVPSHEPLVTKTVFVAAQRAAARRERSRSGNARNSHPATRRSYLFRSFVVCGQCKRRMWGKFRDGKAFYTCSPKREHRPQGHPPSSYVREDYLLDIISGFFSERLFGPERSTLVNEAITTAGGPSLHQHHTEIQTLREEIAAIEKSRDRLIRQLETTDDPNGDLMRRIQLRDAQLADEHRRKNKRLHTLEHEEAPAQPALINALPLGQATLRKAPEAVLRNLFEAFRLKIHYDRGTNTVTCNVTLEAETMRELSKTAHTVVTTSTEPQAEDVPICVVPLSGFEPPLPP